VSALVKSYQAIELSAMKRQNYIFTSESVSEGHPDKVCDQISDAILDEFLKQEPQARTAIETLVTTNKVVIAGEVRGPQQVSDNIEEITRQTIKEIGYEQNGFHWKNAAIDIYVHEQSADIAIGVDASKNKDEGAGDQGLMFGFACNETEALMPAAINYAHRILKSLAEARHSGESRLGPDSKSQVTLRYENGVPVDIEKVLVSSQHIDNVSQQDIREIIRPHIVKVLPENWQLTDDKLLTNPTGKFVIGGPDGDTGLTGRKIIVDTYGGAAPHGGGAFSGKDPTKVDRSAAYAARYLAKNVVGAGLADRCLIQVAYAIGVSQPISFYVDIADSDKVDIIKLEKKLRDLVDLSPRGIRQHLDLNKPIYKRTAAYGHFGRKVDDNNGFPWERLDLIDELKDLLQ